MKVKFEDVSFGYCGNMIINNFNSEFLQKGISIIVGPSGCGKSTFLELICGLKKLEQGKIIIENHVISKKKMDTHNFRKDVNLVLQNAEDSFFMRTVYDEIMYGVKNFKIDFDQAHEDIKLLFKIFDLDNEVLNQDPLTLSGGQQRRVALITTLVLRPKLLLLDEPTIGLDESSKFVVLEYLKNYCKKKDIKIILVTHDPDLICQYSSDVLMLSIDNPIYFPTREKFIDFCFKTSLVDYLDDYHKLWFYAGDNSRLMELSDVC